MAVSAAVIITTACSPTTLAATTFSVTSAVLGAGTTKVAGGGVKPLADGTILLHDLHNVIDRILWICGASDCLAVGQLQFSGGEGSDKAGNVSAALDQPTLCQESHEGCDRGGGVVLGAEHMAGDVQGLLWLCVELAVGSG
eukprot:15349391-Ditylum_brightwellii.AAC.1